MQVVKRDGTFAEYDRAKIVAAIHKANDEVDECERASDAEIKDILNDVSRKGRLGILGEDREGI